MKKIWFALTKFSVTSVYLYPNGIMFSVGGGIGCNCTNTHSMLKFKCPFKL